MRFSEEGKECRLPRLLRVDHLVLGGESEEDLRVMIRGFDGGIYKRKGLKVNVDRSKVMELEGEDGWVYEVSRMEGDEVCLEFKEFGIVLS